MLQVLFLSTWLKTFNTADHDVLIIKLKYYGVCDESLAWFYKNYFSGRKQFVCIESSEELAITSGVPQGSKDWTPVVHCLHQ